ncbi:MAG: hypothetical protein MI864_02375 [Pseudomonadales bacterium]|uniref:hypothetical protein n=1 Tax=Oleiphilus messinensis TaxID=141451 RepID=UPI000B3B4907|nr:hypothetical protein [Oleiphilus messinensis]MCG8609356.1 hypothetical protein [Pseudomonadales bacterium]
MPQQFLMRDNTLHGTFFTTVELKFIQTSHSNDKTKLKYTFLNHEVKAKKPHPDTASPTQTPHCFFQQSERFNKPEQKKAILARNPLRYSKVNVAEYSQWLITPQCRSRAPSASTTAFTLT